MISRTAGSAGSGGGAACCVTTLAGLTSATAGGGSSSFAGFSGGLAVSGASFAAGRLSAVDQISTAASNALVPLRNRPAPDAVPDDAALFCSSPRCAPDESFWFIFGKTKSFELPHTKMTGAQTFRQSVRRFANRIYGGVVTL